MNQHNKCSIILWKNKNSNKQIEIPFWTTKQINKWDPSRGGCKSFSEKCFGIISCKSWFELKLVIQRSTSIDLKPRHVFQDRQVETPILTIAMFVLFASWFSASSSWSLWRIFIIEVLAKLGSLLFDLGEMIAILMINPFSDSGVWSFGDFLKVFHQWSVCKVGYFKFQWLRLILDWGLCMIVDFRKMSACNFFG